nr:MAG TPA: hypothetical protein [Caudoviricetes sp.]
MNHVKTIGKCNTANTDGVGVSQGRPDGLVSTPSSQKNKKANL